MLAQVVLEILLGGEWVDAICLGGGLHLFLELVRVAGVAAVFDASVAALGRVTVCGALGSH